MNNTEIMMEALEEIANYWGEPLPLSSSKQECLDSWIEKCRHLQNVARSALTKATGIDYGVIAKVKS